MERKVILKITLYMRAEGTRGMGREGIGDCLLMPSVGSWVPYRFTKKAIP